jgi:hypothetical protein
MRRGALAVLMAVWVSCASAGDVRGLAAGLAELADSGDWALAGITGGGETAPFDRGGLAALEDGFRDAFTLRIRAEGEGRYVLSGKAAPNRFSMPVALAEDGTLIVSPPAATLMAPLPPLTAALAAPDGLTEAEYLRYLACITSVTESGGRLVLDTADEAGQTVSLEFVPFAGSVPAP